MAKDTIVLKDGTSVELENSAGIGALQVLSPDRGSMLAAWEKFTPENLSEVQIKNAEGLVCGKYTDLLLVSETSIVHEGGILTTFTLREKTEIERLREEVVAIKEGQTVQDGALEDLGAAVSMVMEGGTK